MHKLKREVEQYESLITSRESEHNLACGSYTATISTLEKDVAKAQEDNEGLRTALQQEGDAVTEATTKFDQLYQERLNERSNAGDQSVAKRAFELAETETNKIVADHAAYVTETTHAENKNKVCLKSAEREAVPLKQSILEYQCQAVETRHVVTTMAAEIDTARKAAESASQQGPASIQAIQLLIQDKESLHAEYQVQLGLATNANARSKIAEANVDRLREQKGVADLLLQNLQSQKKDDARKVACLQRLSEERLSDKAKSEDRLNVVLSEVNEAKDCITKMSESSETSQGALKLWYGVTEALKMGVEPPEGLGSNDDDAHDVDHDALIQENDKLKARQEAIEQFSSANKIESERLRKTLEEQNQKSNKMPPRSQNFTERLE